MSSYGTNSLANGLNAIADAGENQTPQQPDPKPIANARKAGAAEFTRQRIRLQAANSARMMRLNSTRSTLSSGGLSRVGTLTASVHGMICEETEFVEPEIAEITNNPQINQMFQTSGHHLSGHRQRQRNREEAQNAGLSQTNQRMSSKDFQRQQQSLPKDDSSDEENDPLSASLSRLRLKQKRQMKENKEQASLRSMGNGRSQSPSKPPDSSWDNLGKAFPTPTQRQQQPLPHDDDSSDEENDPLSSSLSRLRLKQNRQMKENKEASLRSIGGTKLSPKKPPDPSWDNLGTAFPAPTYTQSRYGSLRPQASESTFDFTVSTVGTDDMSLTEMISQSNLMLPKQYPKQFTPNSEGLQLNQLEQHNDRMQAAAAPSMRSLLWKKQKERISQQNEQPPQQPQKHSMMFSGKTAIDAERDDVSSDSDDDTTPSSGSKEKRDQNAVKDHYKNIANKMGDNFNHHSPNQDDAPCEDDRTVYDDDSSDDDDHQSRATANSAADSHNSQKNSRIANRENQSTNYENVQKSSMLQTIRGNNSMVSNGSMLCNTSSVHSNMNSDHSQEGMQAKERQQGPYRRMDSEATARTDNTYRSEGMPPRPQMRPRPDTPVPPDPPTNSKPTILIVGSTLLDRSIYIQQFPKSGSYHRTAPGSVGSTERAGGSAANTATILNHLRDAMVLQDGQDLTENEDEPAGYAEDELIQIRLATKIGDDDVADKIQNDLEDGGNGGIDLNHALFIRVEDTTSPLSTHFVSVSSSPTSSGTEPGKNMGPTSIHQPGTCGELTEEDVLNADLDEVFRNVMHLHTDSQHTAAALLLVREARRRGGISVSILANVDRGVMMDELIELSDVIFTDDDASYFTRRLNATTGQLNSGLGVTKNHDSTNNLLACLQTTTLEDMEVGVMSAPSAPVHRSYSIKLSDKDLDRICIKTARIAHTFSGKEVIILRGPTRGSLHVRHVKHSERSLNPDRYPPARRHSSLFCQYEQLSEKVDNQASMVLGNVSLRSLKECAAPAATPHPKNRRGSHPPTNQALFMEEDTYRIIRAGTLTNMQQHKLLGDTSGANDAYIGGYLLAHLACMGQHDQLHVGTSVELLPLYAMDMNVPNLLLTHLDDERIRFYLLMSTWVAGARIFGNDACSRVNNGQTSNGGMSCSDASVHSLPTGHGDLDERLGTDIVTVKRRLMELIS